MDTEIGGMMNQFKVIAADIDGTLCMKGEDLMPLTRSAIKKAACRRCEIWFGNR